ncbi:cutinase [Gordonia spumicola]|uniref:Cutinase n=1 Tax=Gordonia spumicola TaxID=589161 RepID=A0A7I9V5V2_9ACTN|nr:cutinase family protein [Gordonia spumicola]GEE00584.1 cutinase [Gordonia spumicola]
MTKRLLIVLAAALAIAGLTVPLGSGTATAADCADVQLVFARGTQEADAPVGTTGLALYRSLQNRFPGKDVRVAPVRYQASGAFAEGVDFLKTVAEGVRDAQGQMRWLASNCPSTRIVLGGYSQGAAVVTYAVSDQLSSVAPVVREVPAPLPGSVSRHVAGVILFGAPADRWFYEAHVPPMRVGARYRALLRDYCIPGDNICDGGPISQPNTVHGQYSVNGMTDNAANFVARRVH